jgi:hypothetical protein
MNNISVFKPIPGAPGETDGKRKPLGVKRFRRLRWTGIF